jgi:hypothetical protein
VITREPDHSASSGSACVDPVALLGRRSGRVGVGNDKRFIPVVELCHRASLGLVTHFGRCTVQHGSSGEKPQMELS